MKHFRKLRGIFKIALYWGLCAVLGVLCGKASAGMINKIIAAEENEEEN